MSGADPTRITKLLEDISAGRRAATEELLPIVYDELRRMARAKMSGERPGATLQPTALVHEAYLRLLGEDVRWENRAHFFGAAAEAMRRILVERARARLRDKRGGDRKRVELTSHVAIEEPAAAEMLALDQALDRLARKSPRMGQIVRLRYFAGLSVPDVGQALGLSPRTVDREWAAARAWLHREIASRS